MKELQHVSKREFQVLKLIAEELTTAQIAKTLFISSHTANSHRKNIMQKLGARNTAGLIRLSFENKLLCVGTSL